MLAVTIDNKDIVIDQIAYITQQTDTDFTFYAYTITLPSAIYSNGDVYELDDIDMSFKPKSNNP